MSVHTRKHEINIGKRRYIMAYRIWANHAHLFPKGARDAAQVEDLKQLMAECGIEKAVCFACFENQYKKSGLPGDEIQWLYDSIKDDDSLIGFGTINFDRDDITDQVKRIASFGFKGIKIHPAYQEINIMGEKARQVYAEAQKQGLFISFHTGIHWHRIADYKVLLFDEVSFCYPELRFSLEHIGGYHFFLDALAVMCNSLRKSDHPTVYAGWTSIAPSKDGLPDFWTQSDENLRTVIHQTGNDRSIFGLDFPYKKTDMQLAAIRRIENLDIPEEAKVGIFGKNLADALGMEW